jgi:hypothetical protein
MSAYVKGFGCRPLTGGAANTGGRRPKASKGGNRAERKLSDAAGRYGDLAAAAAASQWWRRYRARSAMLLCCMSGLVELNTALLNNED